MKQSTLPLAGSHALEAELRERCPMLDEISVFVTTRAGFDFKCIDARSGESGIFVEKMWWTQARADFIQKYELWVAELAEHQQSASAGPQEPQRA